MLPPGCQWSCRLNASLWISLKGGHQERGACRVSLLATLCVNDCTSALSRWHGNLSKHGRNHRERDSHSRNDARWPRATAQIEISGCDTGVTRQGVKPSRISADRILRAPVVVRWGHVGVRLGGPFWLSDSDVHRPARLTWECQSHSLNCLIRCVHCCGEPPPGWVPP